MSRKTYELVIIFDGRLSVTDYENKISEYQDLILRQADTVMRYEDRPGKKKLAYSVRGCEQGWYVVFTLDATQKTIDTLEKECRKDYYVLKYLSMETYLEPGFRDHSLESEKSEQNESNKNKIDALDVLIGLAHY